ncbi:MAG: response regulator, partial [Planctomycetales bacterium]|nr:response regulator [Planctomycetales bacterium]
MNTGLNMGLDTGLKSGLDTGADTILVVDDNPTNLQLLFGTLRGLGHKLLVAKSGEDALKVAQWAHPDLILLDI